MYKSLTGIGSTLLVAVLTLSLAGCETKAQTGALVGGAGGAALGAGIGSMSHARAGEGALIGGAVGALGGYLVGNEMDKADQRERDRNAVRATREDRYAAPAPAAAPSQRVTKNDVIKWTDQGTKDEVIIDRIERSGTIFNITAADENELRDAGVSEEVVRAMKDTARR
ncbi:MAG: glycine zipper domain-containing protein [Bacillota bacterium]